MKSGDRKSESGVSLSFSRAEALVLFEFLSRSSEQKSLEIRDQAEQRVLWDVQAELEGLLAEPLSKDYDVHFKKAREEVRGAS